MKKTRAILKAFFALVALFLMGAFVCACAANTGALPAFSQEIVPMVSQNTAPLPAAPAVLQPEPPPEPEPEPLPSVLPALKAYYEVNTDLIGWLAIEGTPIDYPVMYTPEAHDFYLSHNFRKEKDKNGLLVLQADCDPYTPGTNLIIHGHKMKSGKMFGTLAKYEKKSYWQKHPEIRFDTLYARGTYEIIAAFYTKVYDGDEDVFKYYTFLNAQKKEEFDGYIANIKKLALYNTGIEAQFGDTLITLSTCSYHTKDGRFAVVAKRKA